MADVALPMPRPAPDYNEAVVKKFIIAAVFWAIVAFLVGVYIATELAWPQFNLGLSFLNFGRLRPVHTSAAIFAFGGSALLGTSFHVVQRTCRTRLFGGEALANFVFWGYQFFIVMAALSYVMGYSQSQEYAEPEWHIDLWLTVVWVVYAVIFIGTLMKREEPHIYVANWFYLAFILTIAVLHIGNNLAVPISVYLRQELLGRVRRAERDDPVVVWPQRGGLLPDRGLPRDDVLLHPEGGEPAGVFLPAVGGALLVADIHVYLGRSAPPALDRAARLDADAGHGVLDHAVDAVLGRHDQRPDDAVGCVGQAAHRSRPALLGHRRRLLRHVHLRGPGDVDPRRQRAVSHYTDWTIGHVHSGALGWVAFISFGAIYYLVPVLWQRSGLYSLRLVSWHYWIATLGIVFYITSMWVAGIMQGLMWRAYDQFGFLQYSFAESVVAVHPVLCDPACWAD